MTDIDRIIKFFLHIFLLQSGVSGETEGVSDFYLIPSDSESGLIYELRVKLVSGWKTRRMSIRQIGESVQSKSACYAVTYDDLMVLKIPPAPLHDFNKYLENISIERMISKQISPNIQCVSPTLSSILQKVPELAGKIAGPAKDPEEEYAGLLSKEPRYQGHLKIGDRFAFFMSLSKHPFLDQVIEKIHGDKKLIQDELLKSSRLFQSLDAFETVYGDKQIDLYLGIQELLKEFSRKTDGLLKLYETISPIADYQKQEWVFAQLAEKQPEFNQNEFPVKFCDEVNRLLSNTIDEKNKWVAEYRKTVSAYIRKKNLAQNRAKIEALIINTMELVCHLKHSGVAIRDLKPDNMLVVDNPKNTHSQLKDGNAHHLGLIDLETAIDFSKPDKDQIRQPMLAGTPAYMTPSHIFENQVLTDIFGEDIFRIFYMQDWFSAIGIIYATVTGNRLFQKTAKLIPEIIRVQKKAAEKNNSMTETFSTASRIFWKTADEELSEGIDRERHALQLIQLKLPNHVIDLFTAELRKEKAMLLNLVEKNVRSRKFFTKNAQKLIDASYEDIRGQRKKWEKSPDGSQSSPDIRQQVVEGFKLIERLKFKLKDYDGMDQAFEQPLACDEFMKFLFQRVLHAMNQETFIK